MYRRGVWGETEYGRFYVRTCNGSRVTPWQTALTSAHRRALDHETISRPVWANLTYSVNKCKWKYRKLEVISGS